MNMIVIRKRTPSNLRTDLKYEAIGRQSNGNIWFHISLKTKSEAVASAKTLLKAESFASRELLDSNLVIVDASKRRPVILLKGDIVWKP